MKPHRHHRLFLESLLPAFLGVNELHFLPQGPELDLLRSALSPDPEDALRLWNVWWKSVSSKTRLPRILPLLSWRLPSGELSKAEVRLLKGCYRRTWLYNHRLATVAASVIKALQEAGLDVLVLKGLALAYRDYPDPGTRPMQDFDLLVRPEQRARAVFILERLGWRAESPLPAVDAMHGMAFRGKEGLLDLHWHSSSSCRALDSDRGFWVRSEILELPGVTTRTLSQQDMLLHVCLHGAKDSVSPLAWATDACLLLQKGGNFEHFVPEAAARRVVHHLRVPLAYLDEAIESINVPGFLLDTLRSIPVGWLDRLHFYSKCVGGYRWSFWLQPALDYLRSERAGFLAFLARRWGLKRKRDLTTYLWSRAQKNQSGDGSVLIEPPAFLNEGK